MATAGYGRKLTAILSADLKGYSSLMGRDEEATHRATHACLELFAARIAAYQGRVASVAGDGLLADFPSVINALKCAVEVLREIEATDFDMAQGEKIEFRVGVNLGDVIAEEGNIFGDSVNVAARLQQIALPGGICISRAVYEQVKNKLALGYEYLGDHHLKNIAEPVEIYRVHADPEGALKSAAVRKTTEPLALPARPSIAVLPFDDMSETREQGYFCDGITEDIITSLSKFRELFVISRNSSFVFKGKTFTVQQAGRELGVRYLLEGSVRRSGSRVRITAQLIDALAGHHLWADRYDRELTDLFEVQDEVTRVIVAALAVKVEEAERSRVRRIETADLEAYGFLLRGQEHFFQYTREGNARAREMYEQAIARDPGYARAHAALSRTYNDDWRYAWSDSPEASLDKALDLAKKSVALDDSDASGHSELGIVYLYRKDLDRAIAEFERALTLNPNNADIMAELADALAYNGQPEDAVALIREAMRLNPHYPDWYLWHLADALYMLRRYDDAIAALQQMHNVAEGRRLLAASYAQLGRLDEARAQAQEVLKLHPNFSVARWVAIQPNRVPAQREHFVEGLRKAGLPE